MDSRFAFYDTTLEEFLVPPLSFANVHSQTLPVVCTCGAWSYGNSRSLLCSSDTSCSFRDSCKLILATWANIASHTPSMDPSCCWLLNAICSRCPSCTADSRGFLCSPALDEMDEYLFESPYHPNACTHICDLLDARATYQMFPAEGAIALMALSELVPRF